MCLGSKVRPDGGPTDVVGEVASSLRCGPREGDNLMARLATSAPWLKYRCPQVQQGNTGPHTDGVQLRCPLPQLGELEKGICQEAMLPSWCILSHPFRHPIRYWTRRFGDQRESRLGSHFSFDSCCVQMGGP